MEVARLWRERGLESFRHDRSSFTKAEKHRYGKLLYLYDHIKEINDGQEEGMEDKALELDNFRRGHGMTMDQYRVHLKSNDSSTKKRRKTDE